MESNVYRPWALIRHEGKLILFYVTSIHSEGGGVFGGPITGYRGHHSDDNGRVENGESRWVNPAAYIKEWRIRPSEANLDKARERERARR